MPKKKVHNNQKSEPSTSNYDLFDNPMTRAALNALSPEDLERYKHIGESMYGNVNFEGSKVINNMPPPMAEALAYVEEGIKSGLHPSMLDKNEKALLEDQYGKEWYKNFGYVSEDLDCIFTTVRK